MTIVERISNASSLLALLLVLVTLFTSEQAKSLDIERSRPGGGRSGAYRRISAIASALALVTYASVVALLPVTIDVANVCCGSGWDPTFGVFVLVWLLLIPLLIWQLTLAWSAWRA